MKRVLLTGATGFVGRQSLTFLVERGYEIHAVSSKPPVEASPDVRWHKCDLLQSDQLVLLLRKLKPSHLLHFAWYVEPGRCYMSGENFRWVQASLDLLRAFADHGGERAVMAGTCAEYDWKYGFCSETLTPLLPATIYGTCKHALQLLFSAYSQKVSLSNAWGRIFFLYGPYENLGRLVPSVTCSLLSGQEAKCSHGNQLRDYLYSQDVAEAFAALLDSDVQGVVNVASGYPVSVRDIVHKIGQKLNREDLIRLGALSAGEGEPALLVAETKRLFEEVGWQPKYDLDLGLEKTISWWKKHLSGEDTGQA